MSNKRTIKIFCASCKKLLQEIIYDGEGGEKINSYVILWYIKDNGDYICPECDEERKYVDE